MLVNPYALYATLHHAHTFNRSVIFGAENINAISGVNNMIVNRWYGGMILWTNTMPGGTNELVKPLMEWIIARQNQ